MNRICGISISVNTKHMKHCTRLCWFCTELNLWIFLLKLKYFISKEQTTAMKSTKTKFPQWNVETMLSALWDCIFEPMWQCRNNILHNQANHRTTAEDNELSKKLIWFKTNQNTALAYHLQHFANISYGDVKRWSRPTWNGLVSNSLKLHNAASSSNTNKLQRSIVYSQLTFGHYTTPSEYSNIMPLHPAVTVRLLVSESP